MEKLRVQLDEEIDDAIDLVCTAEIDYMVMGMSAETFWGGKEGNRQFKARMSARAGGLDVATGAEACEKALHLFGVKRIAFVTPYQVNGDQQVRSFFEEMGFEVTTVKGLKCPTAVSIAHVTEDELRDAIIEVNETDPQAIVQCGTNLSMVRLAAEAERWLHKPVVAINAATWWFALRENGIDDRSTARDACSRSSSQQATAMARRPTSRPPAPAAPDGECGGPFQLVAGHVRRGQME